MGNKSLAIFLSLLVYSCQGCFYTLPMVREFASEIEAISGTSIILDFNSGPGESIEDIAAASDCELATLLTLPAYVYYKLSGRKGILWRLRRAGFAFAAKIASLELPSVNPAIQQFHFKQLETLCPTLTPSAAPHLLAAQILASSDSFPVIHLYEIGSLYRLYADHCIATTRAIFQNYVQSYLVNRETNPFYHGVSSRQTNNFFDDFLPSSLANLPQQHTGFSGNRALLARTLLFTFPKLNLIPERSDWLTRCDRRHHTLANQSYIDLLALKPFNDSYKLPIINCELSIVY